MATYSVFSPNGELSRVLTIDEGDLSGNMLEGETCIPGVYSLHYVHEGLVLPLPTQPSPHHTFDYTTKQWVDPRTEQTQWPVVRSQRNALLSASDWTQLPDVPLATKETWAIYRQALRDITEQTDPFNINWPVRPDRQS